MNPKAMPSKSARKREHHALQALGEQLITLTDTQLAELPLTESLREAVLLARSIKSRSALRRQRQLIGKLMREAEVEPIRDALTAIGQLHRDDTRLLHQAERWRDRLLREGSAALAEYVEAAGCANAELERLLAALPRAPTAAIEQRTRREIFRQIHADLDRGMQNGRGSL
jgi:ribosome-associated protein